MTDYTEPSQNSQLEGWSLPQQGRDHLFWWAMGISVGFFMETTRFLRNPGIRCSPSRTAKVYARNLVQLFGVERQEREGQEEEELEDCQERG